MRAQLLTIIREIRGSYWFVPSTMVLATIALAIVMERVDNQVDIGFLKDIPWLYQNQPSGARAVLSAIATSMIGVAGVTFSMTIVSVSFAASNIGPRLIGNFMRDTGNQVTLGTFISAFVYCLLVLRTVTDADGANASAYVPHLSVIVALALALLSVVNLIYFIHHIPESINVARIAHQVATELRESLEDVFPVHVGKESDAPEPIALGPTFRVESQAITAGEDGYLQVIDDQTLLELAVEHDLVLRLEYRPGDFVQSHNVLLYAHPSARVTGELADALSSSIVVGPKRTATQNALFLVDQLVEIMMRALSPGINDPITAVGCLDWLQAALTVAVSGTEPDARRYDDQGALRIVVHPVTFERLAAAVFDQPLQYVAANRIAALRTMQVIAELLAVCKDPASRAILKEHARRLDEAGKQCLPVASDRDQLAQRYKQTLALAEDPTIAQSLRDDQGWFGGRG